MIDKYDVINYIETKEPGFIEHYEKSLTSTNPDDLKYYEQKIEVFQRIYNIDSVFPFQTWGHISYKKLSPNAILEVAKLYNEDKIRNVSLQQSKSYHVRFYIQWN